MRYVLAWRKGKRMNHLNRRLAEIGNPALRLKNHSRYLSEWTHRQYNGGIRFLPRGPVTLASFVGKDRDMLVGALSYWLAHNAADLVESFAVEFHKADAERVGRRFAAR